jgi:hypothetical protein
MIRRGLIAGSAADWIKALSAIDRGPRRLPLPLQNSLLDQIALSIDAEAEAREAVRERLPRRQLPRLTR